MNTRTCLRVGLCLLVLAAMILPVIACEKAKQMTVAGTYTSERNAKKYRELKSDGTFFAQEENAAGTGTYEMAGDQITLKFQLGTAVRAKLEGNTMIDSQDGERWTKK